MRGQPGTKGRADVRKTKTRAQDTCLLGQAHLPGSAGAHACVVRDISQAGARVLFREALTAPKYFDLHLLDPEQKRCVERRWQIGRRVGIRFLS